MRKENQYQLTAKDRLTSITILPERGGLISSITLPFQQRAREILFQHHYFDEAHCDDLPGAWPFLFPLCGRLMKAGKPGVYELDGREYQLPLHGFAWRLPWQFKQLSESAGELSLMATDETLAVYPFQFKVTLHYELLPGQLICRQRYENLGDKAMPYHAGFHPYFLVPDKAATTLVYQPIKRFVYNETLTEVLGEQPLFELPAKLDNPALNEALTLLGEEKAVRLAFDDGFRFRFSIEDELFRYIQLYTESDKPFFCIEPWMAAPNAFNTGRDLRWLAPGDVDEAILKLSLA